MSEASSTPRHRRDTTGWRIDRVVTPVSDSDLDGLSQLLVDAVDSGAAVSFLAPLPVEAARDWWRASLAGVHPRGVVLAARDPSGLIGTVQIQPAWAPNQPHRAEVVKLLVHRRARGRGVGRGLMLAIEQAAIAQGFTLLTLDARRGGVADRLYERLGWTRVGVIPRYAVDADGRGLHDTVIYFKPLEGTAAENGVT